MKTLRSLLGEWFDTVAILFVLLTFITVCGVVENLPLDAWLTR